MSDTSGFYKLQKGNKDLGTADTVLYEPTQVTEGDTVLTVDKKAEYHYPVNGWFWTKNEEDGLLMLEMYQKHLEAEANK